MFFLHLEAPHQKHFRLATPFDIMYSSIFELRPILPHNVKFIFKKVKHFQFIHIQNPQCN